MRSTKPLNRTFKPKTVVKKNKVVSERHYTRINATRTPKNTTIRVEAKCPHCGKRIAIAIK